ncbi:MAG: nitroreductase [Chlamydiae bacterium CG10_big_fil_rev_8_21_14_0_10_42_34]|nr:MAG: nitroreductase [Chlamydiae bacterium CG10_big_fil_rev_8_21_14_0_10_42_34]
MSNPEATNRKADHPILPLILNRWSPRSMTGEKISEEETLSLFEAARWAPSSYNNQPWRFVYAKRETPHWDKFFNLLIEFNQSWCANAALLGVIVSGKVFEKNKKPSITYALDAGSAWQNLALEGTSRGLVVHGMQGFDYQKAKEILQIPDDFEVLAMFAVGKKAPKENLPPDLQEREVPSGRKKVDEIAFEGSFR